jgi:hypothetical protein
MGFDLSDLITNTRTITVHSALFGVDVTVTYAPAEYSNKAYALYKTLVQQGEITEAFAKVLCKLIRDWDITRDGKKLPVTQDAIDTLPVRLVGEIWSGIMDDMNPKETSETS